jgi:hypothetical protein
MSRAGLVSSLSMWSIVNVPASTCCRSGGQGIVASLVGSSDCRSRRPSATAADGYGWMQLARRRGNSRRPRLFDWLERLDRHHRPTNRYNRALGVDKTEGVQAVVRAVLESGRDRMTADQLHRLGRLRILRKKSIHFGWIRFARRRIRCERQQLIVKCLGGFRGENGNVGHGGAPFFAV